MNLLRNVIKSNGLQRIKPNQPFPVLLRNPLKHFSTEPENQPSPLPPPPQQHKQEKLDSSSIDSFLQPPNEVLIYGKLWGSCKHTLKTDIISMLNGCNLSPQDIKVEYNRMFDPLGMLVQFHSRSAFDTAIRLIREKGRLYRLDMVDPRMWDVASYDGKTVLLQGLPRNALLEDVERFLCGCDFNASKIQMSMRPVPQPTRVALVPFSSQSEAMKAVLTKNKSFCLNNQILMRVLQ